MGSAPAALAAGWLRERAANADQYARKSLPADVGQLIDSASSPAELQPLSREARERRFHMRVTFSRISRSAGASACSTRTNILLLAAFRPFHKNSHSASTACVTLRCVASEPLLLHIAPTIAAGRKHNTITGTVGRIVGSRVGS
jgi:hypothetical protein